MGVPPRLSPQLPVARLAKALLASLLLVATGTAAAAGGRQAAAAAVHESRPLGSLNAAGDVFAGSSRVSGQTKIFGGEAIRIGEGMATFKAPGERGSFAIFRRSEIVFSDDPRFTAELKSGEAGMRSSSGSNGVALRAGNYVIVASVQGEESDATVNRAADGSFVIDCTQGNIGAVPLAGGQGLLLRSGESTRITAAGQLIGVQNQAGATPAAAPQAKKRRKHAS